MIRLCAHRVYPRRHDAGHPLCAPDAAASGHLPCGICGECLPGCRYGGDSAVGASVAWGISRIRLDDGHLRCGRAAHSERLFSRRFAYVNPPLARRSSPQVWEGAFHHAGHVALAILALGLVGLAEAAVNTLAPSVNQRIIPARGLVRIISVTIVLMSGSEPLSKAASGWIIARIGVPPVLCWAGALEIAVSTVAFFVPVVRPYSTAESQPSA